MEKLNKLYIGYQEIEITELDIIEDFINTFMDFWKDDIIDFKDEIKVKDIDKICIYSYINLDEDLDYIFILKDGSRKNCYVLENEFISWLEKHNLIK